MLPKWISCLRSSRTKHKGRFFCVNIYPQESVGLRYVTIVTVVDVCIFLSSFIYRSTFYHFYVKGRGGGALSLSLLPLGKGIKNKKSLSHFFVLVSADVYKIRDNLNKSGFVLCFVVTTKTGRISNSEYQR